MYLDASGNLVVTTLDAKSRAVVAGTGARAQMVDDSSARLDAIVARLRSAGGERRGRWRPGLVRRRADEHGRRDRHRGSWRPRHGRDDEPRSQFRTERPDREAAGRPGAEAGRVDRRRVRVHPADDPELLGRVQHGRRGQPSRRAHGRTLRRVARGAQPQWLPDRRARTADYPTDDFGTFWNSYPGYWQPSPSVFLYNGTYARVAGQWDNPPVGATVCKSGRTTGFTCGTITAVNQTVTYTGGKVIYGLVRHNACVEGGDSGGANISVGNYALGVAGGAGRDRRRTGPNTGKCLSKSGGANVSWYQPIGEALTRNGLRLLL